MRQDFQVPQVLLDQMVPLVALDQQVHVETQDCPDLSELLGLLEPLEI